MTELENKLSNQIHELDNQQIAQLRKSEYGASINNVIEGLEKEVYTLFVRGDNQESEVEEFDLIYIGYTENSDQPTGFILHRLSQKDKLRNQMIMGFCQFLQDEFNDFDIIDAYNTYQSQLRSALEKMNFWTYTEEFRHNFKGDNATLVLKGKRGVEFIPIIKKIDFLRHTFKNVQNGLGKDFNNYVYLIYNERNGYTKIGTSKQPKIREKTLQGEEPIVEILVMWNAPRLEEKKLHQLFRRKRIRGEWFKLNPKDYNVIQEHMEKYKSS